MFFSFNVLEEFSLALEVTNEILKISPNDTDAIDDKQIFEGFIETKYESITGYFRKRDEEIEKNITKFDNPIEHTDPYTYDEYQQKLYEKLCRNDIKESPKILSALKCGYNSNGSSFLKIAPLKYEEISLEPYIVVYHEVLYDKEIDTIKNMSISKVEFFVILF